MPVSFNNAPAFSRENLGAKLDVDNNNRVTVDDLTEFKGSAPVLETAEPNSPQVDRFDLNSDGIVTVTDIVEDRNRTEERQQRSQLDIEALKEKLSAAAAQSNNPAVNQFQQVQNSNSTIAPGAVIDEQV